MPKYAIEMVETISKRRTYFVTANTESDAREKAEKGETDEEHDIDSVGEVCARHVVEVTEEKDGK